MKDVFILISVLILFLSGCKSEEEKISGNYKIVGYTVNGTDSLSQIGELHLEGRFTLVPANENGLPNAINYNLETVKDTTYSFGGSWILENKSISFLPRTYLKYSVVDTFQVLASFTSLDSGPYPVLFPLAGKWKIEKQGKNSLELIKDSSPNTELHLQRL